jgi:hypothetical protein
MNETKYNIFEKLQEFITDFDTKGYYITGEPKSNGFGDPGQKGKKGGYYYSQKETLESCDMACASKFKTGIFDSEGQRKTYLNIVNFYRDVMKMKIIIKVSNYLFEPRSLSFTWPVWAMGREFGIFAEEESYDDELQDRAHDLATYGSVVSKRTAYCTERVPLRTIRNTQSAKSLYHAASTGGYVIIEDDKHYNEMSEYPDWDVDGLKKSKSYNTFEMYTLVPASLYENEAWKDNGGELNDVSDDEDYILVQAVLIPDEKSKKGDKFAKGKIVWMEKVDEDSWPLDECHTERIDGRWLGKGEVEKQLENQIARNLNANLRRRGLLWATKKVFYRNGSNSDDVPEQLLMEVKDGQMIYVGPNGQIGQVNTSNQHLGEFASDDNAWKENSQQQSFAFNIATGENMPSGTSFSLGVVLDKAVSSHFTRVRNRFSNYLKRDFFNQIIDIFRDEYSEKHTLQVSMGDTDIENLEQSMITYHVNERIFDLYAKRKGSQVNRDRIRMEVEEEMLANPYLFLDIPDNFYDNAHYYMKLNIDDDIAPDINDLTTIYQSLKQDGDPRADQVLAMIMAKRGKSLAYIAGNKPEAPAPVAGPVSPIQPNAPAPVAPMTP